MRLEGKVGLHDSTQLELKLTYGLGGESGDSNADPKYKLESYWFIPKSLGVDKHTYPASRFRQDLKGYMRFNAPNLSFKDLTDAEDSEGFLSLLRSEMEVAEKTGDCSELNRALRMYGSLVRARVRARSARVVRGLERALENDSSVGQKVVPRCDKLVQRAVEILNEWRQFLGDLRRTDLPMILVQTAANVDEYMSLVLEEQAVRIIALCDKVAEREETDADMQGMRTNLVEFVNHEQAYRKGAGYSTILDRPGSDDEHYLYRRGALKKFVASALWLDVVKKRGPERMADMAAAIAAGVAMAIALIITYVHSQYYMMNTMGFLVAATVTYMLKDRVKDWLKRFFAARIATNPSTSIIDPDSGRQIATSRESVSYIGMGAVPEAVKKIRARGPDAQSRAQAVPEVVLRYEKQTQIAKNANSNEIGGASELTDIIRVGIQRFLARVDDPVTSMQVYNPALDKVEKRDFPKVYHINVVMVLTPMLKAAKGVRELPEAEAMIQRLRVVFDKNGILRLEDTDSVTERVSGREKASSLAPVPI